MKTGSHREFHTIQAGGGASPLPATIADLLARIERLEEQLRRLVPPVNDSNDSQPGQAAYERAIRALAAGDQNPLKRFLKNGGKIPMEGRT